MLARNVANNTVADATERHGLHGGVQVRRTGTPGDPVEWTDNADSSLDLSTVVAVSVRLIINKKMGGAPSYVDLTTTVRLRNASSE